MPWFTETIHLHWLVYLVQRIWAAATTGLRLKKKNPSSCNLALGKTKNKEHSVHMQLDSQEEEEPEVGQMGRTAIN